MFFLIFEMQVNLGSINTTEMAASPSNDNGNVTPKHVEETLQNVMKFQILQPSWICRLY